jgi:hypothetical protein
MWCAWIARAEIQTAHGDFRRRSPWWRLPNGKVLLASLSDARFTAAATSECGAPS